METEKIELTGVVLATGNEARIAVEITEGDNVSICGEYNGVTCRGESEAYFEAFRLFRDEMLSAGVGLKCEGARLNVHASVMMENVPKVYTLTIGVKPTRADIVGIFDFADLDEFPDTAAQIAFSQKWFDSL